MGHYDDEQQDTMRCPALFFYCNFSCSKKDILYNAYSSVL